MGDVDERPDLWNMGWSYKLNFLSGSLTRIRALGFFPLRESKKALQGLNKRSVSGVYGPEAMQTEESFSPTEGSAFGSSIP